MIKIKKIFRKISNNKARFIILGIILLNVILLFLDYYNIANYYNINIVNLNWNFIDILINSSIAIVLYLCTYYLIEKNNIKKHNNKLNIMNYILKTSYQECLNYIELLNSGPLANEMFLSKVGKPSELSKNDYFNDFVNFPFSNHDLIINLINDGNLDVEKFKKYFEIKNDYRTYIAQRVAYKESGNEILEKQFKIAEKTLISIIKNEMQEIDKCNK